MSMVKLFYSDSFDTTADVGMRLFEDTSSLKKSASTIFGMDYDALKPDKDHVGIHVVALGAHERYGCNRNFDAFSKAACLKYHDTFVKHGHVYRHHRNKDPEKALGQIKVSAYNPEMDRVELFIHANKEKAADELARLEKEGEIPFSMACVLDPEYPVLTRDRGYVAISTITTADYVLAEDRQWHQVTALNRRVYTGPCSRLHFYGLSMPLALTDDHMLKMKLFGQPDSVKRAFRDSAAYDECTPDWAHVSHVVVNDRVMAQAPGRYPGYCAIDSIDLARMMGYYLAEGSFGFNGDRACTVNLTCNMSDSLPRVVPEIIERMLPGTTCKMRPHRVSTSCLNVEIFNTEFAELLRKYVGRTCHLKFICPELFNSDEDVKLAYLGAWLDGDGFVDIKGVHWSTCNRNLALQGRDLLASIGIPSSMYAIDHAKCETSGHVGSGMEYTLNISRCDATRLAPWSSKVSTNKFPAMTRSKPPAMRAESSDQLLYAYRVKHVDHYDVVDAQTYNIEVADCPSYTIGGLISHNCRVQHDRCSICGNLRKNASDPNQCDHIKNEFGKTYDDGKVAFTFNDEPDFFDISFVGRPADRIAWQLKVASADTASSIKLAEYEGVTLPDSLAIDSKIGLRKLAHLKAVVYMHDAYRGWFTKTAQQKSSRDFYLYELRKAAGAKLPDSVIARLREFEPTAAFTAMAKAGMVMDVESFFKYAMGPEYPQLQDLMPEISLAVPRVMKTAVDSGTCQNLCNVSTFDVPERQSYMAGEVPGSLIVKMASAAVVGQPRDERIIAATVEQKNIKLAVDTAKKIESNTALTEALAEKYAAYQLSAIDAVLSFHDTDPDYVRAISAAQNLMM